MPFEPDRHTHLARIVGKTSAFLNMLAIAAPPDEIDRMADAIEALIGDGADCDDLLSLVFMAGGAACARQEYSDAPHWQEIEAIAVEAIRAHVERFLEELRRSEPATGEVH